MKTTELNRISKKLQQLEYRELKDAGLKNIRMDITKNLNK